MPIPTGKQDLSWQGQKKDTCKDKKKDTRVMQVTEIESKKSKLVSTKEKLDQTHQDHASKVPVAMLINRSHTKGGFTMLRLKDTKAFTLLEVMITLLILSVGMLGLATLQIMAIRGNSFGQQMTIASTLAQNKLEELREDDFDSIGTGNDVCVDQVNRCTYSRQWLVQDDTPQANMKTVEVRVTWTGAQADRAVSMGTIISSL